MVVLKVMLIVAVMISAIRTDSRSESLKIWAGAGAGPCTLGFGSAHCNVSAGYGWAVVSLRRTGANGSFLGEGDFLRETGVLLGVISRNKEVTVSIEAGIGWIDGYYDGGIFSGIYGDYEPVRSVAMGSQLMINPWKYFGLGIYAYLNINEHKTFAGMHFAVYLGQLKNQAGAE